MNRIEIKHLNKYLGTYHVLKDVNLSLEGGKIYGFIGRNGSGKTMLFRTVAGLLEPSDGEILFNGKPLREYGRKDMPKIGVLIENASLLPGFTGLYNLKYLANINRHIGEAQIRAAIERVGLNPDDKRPFKKYSLGMKQRILLAQAVMEEPDFLLLDEPTNGLDKDSVDDIRAMIAQQAQRGAVVLIASHVKEDIEQLCSETFLVEKGKISAQANTDDPTEDCNND